MNNNIVKLNESDLFMKYKSTYTSAFLDLSIHSCNLLISFYLLWLFRNSFISIFTIPFSGLLLHRNFIVFHDCCHNSYTPNKELNYIISSVYGITTFTSTNWILDHKTHHVTNGNIENEYNFKFNELLYYNVNQYKKFNKISKYIFSFFHTPIVFFSFFPILYFFVIQRFIYIVKKIKYGKKINLSMLSIYFNHFINNVAGVYLITIIYKNNFLFHYLTASYIGFLINFLLFFNQHTYNPPYVVGNKEWSQRNSGLLGSSFIEIPTYLKYFTMGIEYHHIHHMNSKIPGYNLQKYHEDVVSKSNMFENIIKLNMYDCYNNLWLVLYDEDKHKYSTLKEVNG